ncbi:MAG TPA: hypothetical protein VGD02_03160, partial [Gemmatimonadaceae bacterium]
SFSPAWTPDGKAVTFVGAKANDQPGFFTKRIDGGGEATRVRARLSNSDMEKWSPDRKWLIFNYFDKDDESDIVGLRPGIDTAPVPLVSGHFMEWGADISPDGRWLAYQSDETALYQIYVVPFPDTKSRKWVVTASGGIHPKWGPRGDELFYRDTSGDVFAIPVKTAPSFSAGPPKRLFGAKRAEFPLSPYAITRDDQRVLMVRLLDPHPIDKVIVVENWLEEVKNKRK